MAVERITRCGARSMEHRIRLARRQHPESLQSHWLAPVTLNNRGPFAFAVEPSRDRTLVTARTLDAIGVRPSDDAPTIATSGKLAYPLVTLQSIAVGGAAVNDVQVVVWGTPVIPPELLTNAVDKLVWLGTEQSSAINSIVECRGILGLDFLGNFKVSFDFGAEILVLER